MLGIGSSFTYNEGVLCYISGHQIRVLRVCEDISSEHVLEIPNLAHANCGRKIHIVSSTSSSVIITYRDAQFQTNNLLSYVALDLAVTGRPMQELMLFHTKMPFNPHSFVRQTSSGAVYGYLSASLNGWHGHRQWVFEFWQFSEKRDYKTRTLPTLHTHPGHDIGVSVVFEIFEDKFYVVSNQDTLTSEEANPASHYYVSSYPLKAEELGRPDSWKLWRRNHRDGPLDDNWTNLRLRRDESSDRLMITETRKEWVKELRKLKRTHYSQDLHEGAKFEQGESPEPGDGGLINSETDAELGTPPPDVIRLHRVQIENELSRRAKETSQAPIKKMCHVEYLAEVPPPGFREFLSSRLRYSAYIRSSAAYLDIVIDDGLAKSLRVRVQPRTKKIQPVERQHLATSGYTAEKNDYVDSPTRLWPPDDASQQLLEMLNPISNGNETKFHAASNERSIIYMVEPLSEGNTGLQPIIMINFDPAIDFEDLPKLGEESPSEIIAKDLAPMNETSNTWLRSKSGASKKPICQKVPAAWKSLRRGSKLR